MRIIRIFAALAIVGVVASCGYSKGDRALSGAGVGGATGAVGAAVVGGSVLTGAAVGAAAGSLIGVLTDADDINLE